MNSEKQVMRYEISSDDEEELVQDHDSTIMIGGGTIKRSYDCTFCKRGFTNAQALGGHMNIHRKDRAKSKQVITPNNNSSSSSLLLQNTTIEEELMVLPNFSSEFSNQFPTRNYSILESQRNNCDMSSYFHPPPPSNSYLGNQYAHSFQYHEVHNNLRSQPVNFNDEFGGANLSLQIGPSHVDNANQSTKGTPKDGEVDLELRLGHDPC